MATASVAYSKDFLMNYVCMKESTCVKCILLSIKFKAHCKPILQGMIAVPHMHSSYYSESRRIFILPYTCGVENLYTRYKHRRYRM